MTSGERVPEPERLRRWRLLLGSPAEQGLGFGAPGTPGPAGTTGGGGAGPGGNPPFSPPAWHPDPSGRFQFRWWNGSEWTSQVAADGKHLIDTSPDQRIGPY